MSEEERTKADSFVKSEDFERYVLSHFYLRTLLTRYDPATDASQWHFTHSTYGKPAIANVQKNPLYFNLSHSATNMAVICSTEEHCGIDVESKKKLHITEGMCELVFSKEELWQYHTLPQAMQEYMFYRYWTLKEAHLKALGSGLMHLAPSDLNFANTIMLDKEANSFSLESGQYWSHSFDNKSFLSFCLINRQQKIMPKYYFSV